MYNLKLTLIAICAGFAFAASIPGLPACAGNCVTSFGSCQQLNIQCICSDTSLIDGLACCVSTACNKADQDTTIQFAQALCGGEGVTNLPKAATCTATGSATGSSTRAPPVLQGTTSVPSATSSTSSASNGNGLKLEAFGLGLAVAGMLAAI